MIEIREVDEFSLRELDKYARPEEVAEVLASHNLDIYHAAKRTNELSVYSYAIYDKELLALVGVCPKTLLSGEAIPWLLTTTWLRENPRPLLKHTKEFITKWLEEWSVLENWVDARYEASLRWAKWSGFKVFEAEPYGYWQMPFHKIRIGD